MIRGKASGYRGIKKDKGEGKRNREGEKKEGEEQRRKKREHFPRVLTTRTAEILSSPHPLGQRQLIVPADVCEGEKVVMLCQNGESCVM